MKRKAFSVGCVHFAFTEGFPIEISASEYENEIVKSLNKMESVERLQVKDKSESTVKRTIEKEIDLTEGDQAEPYPLFFKISFDLYIPERLQLDICKKYTREPSTFTEHFNVTIIYEFYAPICFIECIKPSEFPDPSNAFVIIRDFLNDRFLQLGERFELQRLGPSPFHADFYLLEHQLEDSPEKPEDEKNWKFTHECSRRRGYDILLSYYNPDYFDNIEEAQDILYNKLAHELSTYYLTKRYHMQNLNAWISIEEKSNEIFRKENNNILKKIFNIFSDGKNIEDLVLQMSKFESERLHKNTITQKAISEILNIERTVFLEKEIKGLTDEEYVYPVKQLRELISFFDSQRSRIMNSIAVIFAAIMGGIIGSLFTIFFSQP